MATTKPDLTRIWAVSAAPTEVVDPDITPGGGKFSLGWDTAKPDYQNFNFLQQHFTKGLAYLNENGLGEWDASTTYAVGGIVRGSDSSWYECLIEQAGNDPVSDTTNWTLWHAGYAAMKASSKNSIVDGVLDLWPEGDSFTTGNEYTSASVKWENNGSGGSVTRQEFTLGQTDVPGNPKNYLRATVSSVAGAANYFTLVDKIESVRTHSGETVTFSFWAKADSAKNIAVDFLQYFGSGGSPSASVNFGATTLSLTTSWARYTVTASVPSISGKTLGTNGNDYIQPVIWMDAGSSNNARTNSLGQQSGTFDFALFQVEPGSVATDFEKVSLAESMARAGCAFEYETRYSVALSRHDTTYAEANITFRYTKKRVPSITLFTSGLTPGSLTFVRAGSSSIDAVAAASSVSVHGCYVFSAALDSLRDTVSIKYKADARL